MSEFVGGYAMNHPPARWSSRMCTRSARVIAALQLKCLRDCAAMFAGDTPASIFPLFDYYRPQVVLQTRNLSPLRTIHSYVTRGGLVRLVSCMLTKFPLLAVLALNYLAVQTIVMGRGDTRTTKGKRMR